MKKQLVILLTGLFTMAGSFAQTTSTYWWEPIDTVSVPGYYHIELSQEIAGLRLDALRIWDANDTEIPYLVRSSVPVKEIKQMEMYDLVSSTQQDSLNTVVVYNKEGAVSRFYLLMKEAEVAKYIAVRGSYDRKQWFSVKQESMLNSEQNPTFGEMAVVDFPEGDYTYYELTVSNNSRSPLNITGVGRMEENSVYGRLVPLSVGLFAVGKDEKGNTLITFPSMQYPYYLSGLELQVEGKGHYSREVRLTGNRFVLNEFRLTSRDEPPFFYFDNLLIPEDFQIVIENERNLPLNVTDVRLFGLSRYLCAYLDAHMSYRIETNGSGRKAYDIESFADDIPYTLPVVRTGGIEKMETIVPEREPNFFERPLFLWGVIALTGIGLLLICIRMLKELKKKE